ncbi:MFS transporter [Peribacillus simplex]|uniref:MFS transporter n=1 Tax=Peribacillus simplex TaxID=1478 RepID=UPI00298E7A1D|nr:MFS transporter [Peribacillus simplex]MDW7617780.1 MFS transporter [Peribacillus simplex]
MNTVFRKLWPIYLAYLLSQFGNWAFRTGVVYAIYDQQNGSNTVLGWTIVLVYVPIVIGGKLLSPLADRFNSRNMLIFIDCIRALLLVPILFIPALDSSFSVAICLIIVTLLSLFTPVFSSAQSVYIRKTIDKENITPSLAIISNLDWFSTLVGTMCGPLLLMYFDFKNIVIVDLLTFVASLLIFIFLLQKGSEHKEEKRQNDKEKELPLSGEKLDKMTNLTILAIFFLNLGAGVINVYPNVVARNVYGVGEVGLSYIYLANGIGGFLGAFMIARLRKKFKLINIITSSSIFIACSLLGMSILNNFYLSIITSSLMLLFGQFFGVGVHSYLLKNNPANQAGRITGLFMYATFSGVALNAILFATLLSKAQVQTVSIFLIFCAASSFVSMMLLFMYKVRLSKQANIDEMHKVHSSN